MCLSSLPGVIVCGPQTGHSARVPRVGREVVGVGSLAPLTGPDLGWSTGLAPGGKHLEQNVHIENRL